MEAGPLLLLAAVGLAAGFLNVLAGGGALLSIPVMLWMGFDGPQANGSNRLAVLANNATAVAGFSRQGWQDGRLSLSLALFALPGTWAGALLGSHMGTRSFKLLLMVVMAGALALSFSPAPAGAARSPPPPVSRRRWWLAHLLMIAVGFYAGLIQAAVGLLLMAVLERVLGLDLVRVNRHKVFIIGVCTVVSLFIFTRAGQVAWIPALALAAGTAMGGWLGAQVAMRQGAALIRRVYQGVLVVFLYRLLDR